MVKFIFNFLLGIPSLGDEGDGEDKLSGESGPGARSDAHRTECKVDKPTFACHIDYVLAPEEQAKSIDIICWGAAAKIYAEGDSTALTPLTLGRIRWIYFRVEHVTDIDDEGVGDYLNHNIVVKASPDGRKLGQAAKCEKAKVFYGRRKEVGDRAELFPPLWENMADVEEDGRVEGCLSTDFESGELSRKVRETLNALTEEYNDETAEREGTAEEREQPPWRRLGEMAEEAGDVVKGKSGRKGSETAAKTKTDGPSDVSFVISGESVLSGLKTFQKLVKYNSEELPFLLSVVKVKDVLTHRQAKCFSPMSVTLKHLKFMPMAALERESIRAIRFGFVVCDRYEAQSNQVDVKESMHLSYTRTILTHEMDANELMEFIQTKGLKVRILGIRGDEAEGARALIYKEQRISSKSGLPGTGGRRRPRRTTEPVLLGTANVDISSVLREPHRLSVEYNFSCQHTSHRQRRESSFPSTVNPTEVNTHYQLRKEGLCHILTASQAVLSLSVRLCFPTWHGYQFKEPSIQVRNRIVVAANDTYTAMAIFGVVQAQNEDILAPTDYSKSAKHIARPLSAYHKSFHQDSELVALDVTGFLIDCVDYYLIYVEGTSLGVLQEIWSIASIVEPVTGRVLYDSSLVFTGVSHEELIRYGGFYVISLRQSPTALLFNKSTYKAGNIPIPAYKALLQLHQLSHCPSITTAVQNDLIPDYYSLLSLDLEFGGPLKFPHPVY